METELEKRKIEEFSLAEQLAYAKGMMDLSKQLQQLVNERIENCFDMIKSTLEEDEWEPVETIANEIKKED